MTYHYLLQESLHYWIPFYTLVQIVNLFSWNLLGKFELYRNAY